MTRPFLPGLAVAFGVLLLGLIVAFTVGRYPVSLTEIVDVLAARATGRPTGVSPAVENVVLLVRGPRVAAAVLIGAALAVAGTAFQGLFRNPLVSPDILGASSGVANDRGSLSHPSLARQALATCSSTPRANAW